jgi:sortase B
MDMKKRLYNIMCVVFTLVFLVSAGYLGFYMWETYNQETRYDDLAQLRPAPQTRPLPKPAEPETEDAPQTQPTEQNSDTVEVTDPRTGETRTILAEFAHLYEMNSDLVGWMSIPAIGVDYPVVQTPDDPEYYLRRNFDKEKSTGGCLFVEAACDMFAPSDNITVYGHRMRNGTMFGQLNKFTKRSFRDENPYIFFDCITELRTYEIMAVFLTTASVGEGFVYHSMTDFGSEAEFDTFVQAVKKLSYYKTDVDAQFGDQLICLSTCDYSLTNGRLVVVAKRVA